MNLLTETSHNDGTIGWLFAPRAAVSFSEWNKYQYGLQIVLGVSVYACDMYMYKRTSS